MAGLVFDVGLHNGSDTAYYLHRGYDVVAVEANPRFCALAERRFAPEIAAGRLEIRSGHRGPCGRDGVLGLRSR